MFFKVWSSDQQHQHYLGAFRKASFPTNLAKATELQTFQVRPSYLHLARSDAAKSNITYEPEMLGP